MHIIDDKEDGKEVHIFYCDVDYCLRRAFVTKHFNEELPKEIGNSLDGWNYKNPEGNFKRSEMKHYCSKHP